VTDIVKPGLVVWRGRSILLCRKRGLSSLILPGGKREPGETDEECLRREIAEELGCRMGVPRYLGTFEDEAASDQPEPPRRLRVLLYEAALEGEPSPCNEIVEVVWVPVAEERADVSPILARQILPALRALQ